MVSTITLYLDVEERRESRPGVEQNMSGQGILASIFVFVLIFVFVQIENLCSRSGYEMINAIPRVQ